MAGVTSKDLVTSLDELTYANRDTNKVNYRGSSELGKEEFYSFWYVSFRIRIR